MVRIVSSVILFLLFATQANTFRFVCNGYLANGEERSDECGVCDADHAARWDNPNIPVVVDESPTPENITQADWRDIIRNSFKAWEGVGGTSLQFVQVQSENVREFGANAAVHEIFWITDRDEWRRLVGSGEFGTLGATLPRYSCEGEGSPRVIFDADLVLNGMPHINWAVDCQSDDCISVQTTLVHELGHFFGLDHPCLMCSSSIMSARAGFDLINPVFDDMQGLRTLYPDRRDTGGFGFACSSDNDCNADHRCIGDGSNRYCSKSCISDGECEQNSICRNVGATKACTFMDSEAAGGRSEGANCMKGPCIEPLICAGASEPNFYCFAPCKSKLSCKPNEECVKLEDDLSLCVGIKNKGDVCTHRELCEEHLFCVFDNDTTGFCRAACEPTITASTGCNEGERCELLENRIEICMPANSELILDEHSDGFGQNAGTASKPNVTPEESAEPMGCSQTNGQSISLLVLALFLLGNTRRIVRRRNEKKVDTHAANCAN